MLSDQVMMPSLKKKWGSLSEDARVTLEVSFINGILRPVMVPEHFCYTKILRDIIVEFHHFRIGYATFIIALIDGFPPILYDMVLEDGLPLYPC
jgi:hypothetical protein